MDRTEALARLSRAKLGHLATIRPEPEPHVVPVTFAVVGNHLVTAVDHKPKTTTSLQRLVNVQAHPRASLLVDHYSENWDQLWWVRVDGAASVHTDGSDWEQAREALADKYPQYNDRPPDGPAIRLEIETVISWESTP